mmetsp:Transcript_28037/g.94130  ORF Transcript_28037/g.94130 Transcript_28037/m.94130 type:complete len:609 (-) Transcript_28037:703-2529(-)
MLAQLVGALGTVDVERHSAVRRVRLQQQNQRPLPLNRGAQLAQAVAGAHVVGGGCAVGDGGRARQQHDHGLRVAHMLLQPRGVVQVVHVQEGRDVLDIPLQLPLERLCLVLPARPHVGEEDVVPPIRQPHRRDDPRLVVPRPRLGPRDSARDGAVQRPAPRQQAPAASRLQCGLPARKVALRVPDDALEVPPPPLQPHVDQASAEAERNQRGRQRRDEFDLDTIPRRRSFDRLAQVAPPPRQTGTATVGQASSVASSAVALVGAFAQLPPRRGEGDPLLLLCVEDDLVAQPERRRAGRVLHDREVHPLHLPVGVEGDVAGEELDERRAAERARHGGRLERARPLDGGAQGAERREGRGSDIVNLGRVLCVAAERAHELLRVGRAVPAGKVADVARHRRVPRHRLQRVLALPPAAPHLSGVLVVDDCGGQDGSERREVLLLLQAEPLQLLHRDDAAGLVRADEDDGGALAPQVRQRAPHLPPVLFPIDAAPLWNRRVRYDAGAGCGRRSRQDPRLGIPPLSLGAAADRPPKGVFLLDVPDAEARQARPSSSALPALVPAAAALALFTASVAVLGGLEHCLEAAPRPVLAAREQPKHERLQAVLLRERGG